MAFDLGQARGEIIIDASGATRGVRQAQASLNGLSQSAQTVGFGLSALGRSLLGIGTTATLGIGVAVKQAADFQEALANVATISDQVAQNVEGFGESLLNISERTNRSATDVADAFYQIVSAAIEGDQALKVLEVAAISANAGLTTTSTAANILTSILNSGVEGLDLATFSMEDLTRVSDILFQSVNRGVFTYEQFATALGDSLPLAAGLQVNLTELGAAYAILTRNGQTANEASTQINAVFSALLKPSTALTEILQGLGYESGSAIISALGFAGALEAIETQISATGAEVDDFSGNIRAVRGFLGLTNSAAGSFADEVANIGEATGATNNALEQQSRTFNFAVTSLVNALKRLAIEVGNTLIPTLTKIVNFVTKVVKYLESIPAPVKAAIAAFIGIGGALTVALGILSIFSAQLISISAAFNIIKRNGIGLRGIFGSLIKPVNMLGQSIGNVATASGSSATQIRSFGRSLFGVKTSASAASPAVKSIADQVKELERALPKAAPNITSMATAMTAFKKSLSSVPKNLERIVEASTKMPAALTGLDAVINTLVAPMTALSDPIKKVGSGFSAINRALPALLKDMGGLTPLFTALVPSITALGDPASKLGNGFRGIGASVEDIGKFLPYVKKPLDDLIPSFTALQKPVASVGGGFSKMRLAAKDLPGLLPSIDKPLADLLPTFTKIQKPIKDVGNAFGKIRLAAKDLPNTLPGIATPLQALEAPIKAIAATAPTAGSGLAKIATAFTDMSAINLASLAGNFDDISLAVKNVDDAIGNSPAGLASLSSSFKSLGTSLPAVAAELPQIATGLNDIDGPLASLTTSIADAPMKLESMAKSFKSLAASLPGLVTPLGEISSKLSSIATNIGDAPPKLTEMSAAFKSMATNLPKVAKDMPTVATAMATIASNVTSSVADLERYATGFTTLGSGISTTSAKIGSVSTGLKSIADIITASSGNIASFADEIINLGAATELLSTSLTGAPAKIRDFSKALSGIGTSIGSIDIGKVDTVFKSLGTYLDDVSLSLDKFITSSGGVGGAVSSIGTSLADLNKSLPSAAKNLPILATGMASLSTAVGGIDAAKISAISLATQELGAIPAGADAAISSIAKSLSALGKSLLLVNVDTLGAVSGHIKSLGSVAGTAEKKIASAAVAFGGLADNLALFSADILASVDSLDIVAARMMQIDGAFAGISTKITQVGPDIQRGFEAITSAVPPDAAKFTQFADDINRIFSGTGFENIGKLSVSGPAFTTSSGAVNTFAESVVAAGAAVSSLSRRLTTLLTKLGALSAALGAATTQMVAFTTAAKAAQTASLGGVVDDAAAGAVNMGRAADAADDLGDAVTDVRLNRRLLPEVRQMEAIFNTAPVAVASLDDAIVHADRDVSRLRANTNRLFGSLGSSRGGAAIKKYWDDQGKLYAVNPAVMGPSKGTIKAAKATRAAIGATAKGIFQLGRFSLSTGRQLGFLSKAATAAKYAFNPFGASVKWATGPLRLMGKTSLFAAKGIAKLAAPVSMLGVRVLKMVVPFKLIGRWLNLWRIGFKALVLPLKLVTFLIQGLATAVFFLLSPLGLLLATTAFFAAAFIRNWFGIRDKVNGVIDGLAARFKTLAEIAGAVLRISNIRGATNETMAAAYSSLRQIEVDKIVTSIAERFNFSAEATERFRSALTGLVANVGGLRATFDKAEIALTGVFDIIGSAQGGTRNFATKFRYLKDVFGTSAANGILSGAGDIRLALQAFSKSVDESFGEGSIKRFRNWFKIENLFTNLAKVARSLIRTFRYGFLPVLGKLIEFFLKFTAVVLNVVNALQKGNYEDAFRIIGRGLESGFNALLDAARGVDGKKVYDTVVGILEAAFSIPLDIGIALIKLTPDLAAGIWGKATDFYGWIKQKLFGDKAAPSDGTDPNFNEIPFGTVLLAGAAALGGVIADVARDFNDWIMKEIFGDDYSENQEIENDIGTVVLNGAVKAGGVLLGWVENGVGKVKDWFRPIYNAITVPAGDVTVEIGSLGIDDGSGQKNGSNWAVTVVTTLLGALWDALDDGRLIVQAISWANGLLERLNKWIMDVDFDESALYGAGGKLGIAITKGLSGGIAGADLFKLGGGTAVANSIIGQDVANVGGVGSSIATEVARLIINVFENRVLWAVLGAKVAIALGAFVGGIISGAIAGASFEFGDNQSNSQFVIRLQALTKIWLTKAVITALSGLDIKQIVNDALKSAGIDDPMVTNALANVVAGLTGFGLPVAAIPFEEIQFQLDVTSWAISTNPNALDSLGNVVEEEIKKSTIEGLRNGELLLVTIDGGNPKIITRADYEAGLAMGLKIVDVTANYDLYAPEVQDIINDAAQDAVDNATGDGTGVVDGGNARAKASAEVTVDPLFTPPSEESSNTFRSAAAEYIAGLVAGASEDPKVETSIGTAAGNLVAGISGALNKPGNNQKLSSAMNSIVNNGLSGVRGRVPAAQSAGAALAEGLAIGMASRVGSVIAAATYLANAANNTFRAVMQVKSPSKVWTEFGSYMGEGLAIGMESTGQVVARASDVLAAMATPTAVPYQSYSPGYGYGANMQTGPVFNNAIIYMPNAETAEAVATYFMNYSRSRY